MAPPLLLASHSRQFIRRVRPDSRCARAASFLVFQSMRGVCQDSRLMRAAVCAISPAYETSTNL